MISLKTAALAAGTCMLVAAAAPTVASGVEKFSEVIVANGDDRPVPTKAIGTANVAVPGGVTVNGTVPVEAQAERTQILVDVGPTGATNSCEPVPVPAGKRLVAEVVHVDVLVGHDADADPGAYVRTAMRMGNFERGAFFSPQSGYGRTYPDRRSGTIEGPFLADGNHTGDFYAMNICSRAHDQKVRAIIVGTLESL